MTQNYNELMCHLHNAHRCVISFIPPGPSRREEGCFSRIGRVGSKAELDLLTFLNVRPSKLHSFRGFAHLPIDDRQV